MRKRGGPGTLRKKCVARICVAPVSSDARPPRVTPTPPRSSPPPNTPLPEFGHESQPELLEVWNEQQRLRNCVPPRWAPAGASLRAWQLGLTGYPLVDAAMRQLWAWGWQPNYVRHVVASFLVVAARVAVLDAIFRAVVNSLFVVVPPGQPVPGYVYHADAAGPGGIVAEKPEARAPPGEDAETTTPATTDDSWAPWAGASLPAPPPPNPNPNPNPPNPSPNPSPPNGIISPAEYSSSPAPPPLGIAPPTDRCGAGGSSSAAWSCVGECAMCIFDPAASEPNCCCDEECAALGDCCADFAETCGGALRGGAPGGRLVREREET